MGLSTSTSTPVLNRNIMDKLKYIVKDKDSEELNDLYLIECKINDEILKEITLEWFINKKLFNNIKGL